jgi:hypothetical protein
MHARLLLPLTLLLAACGGSGASSDPASTANALVDPDGDLPTVFELSAVPGSTSEMLLSTNRGLFKVSGGKATPMPAKVTADGTTAAVGKTMAMTATDDGQLVGSGHPNDEGSPLPTELGILRSEDGGSTWTSVARLGDADIHMFVARHDRIYAWDAVLGAVLVSTDDGKTFKEGITPPGPVADMAVDPEDPDAIVITGETAAFRSEDGGETWRPLTSASDARLAWPEGGPLVRADADGSVHHSTDGGETWESVGSVEEQPQDFHVTEDGTLHLATADGSIFRSADAGRTWQPALRA